MYYEQLKNYVYQHEMLVDNLIYKVSIMFYGLPTDYVCEYTC